MSIDDESPPEGVNHYESIDQLPHQIRKYWPQRYDIFSKWDDGIWLTDDAWFGVTPEPIATKIATHLSTGSPASKTILIDAFAGAGGNAIAFALSGRWKQIFAIEKDATTLACAKHNARLYGVERKIWWILGDCFEVLNGSGGRLKSVKESGAAVVFASPPWGGPGYVDAPVFSLATALRPYSLSALTEGFMGFAGGFVVLFLPRTSDLNEIAAALGKGSGARSDGGRTSVVHYCMRGSSKAMCVYYGDFELDKTITGGADE